MAPFSSAQQAEPPQPQPLVRRRRRRRRRARHSSSSSSQFQRRLSQPQVSPPARQHSLPTMPSVQRAVPGTSVRAQHR